MKQVLAFAREHVDLAAAVAALAVAFLVDGPLESLAILVGGGIAVASRLFPPLWKWVVETLPSK